MAPRFTRLAWTKLGKLYFCLDERSVVDFAPTGLQFHFAAHDDRPTPATSFSAAGRKRRRFVQSIGRSVRGQQASATRVKPLLFGERSLDNVTASSG